MKETVASSDQVEITKHNVSNKQIFKHLLASSRTYLKPVSDKIVWMSTPMPFLMVPKGLIPQRFAYPEEYEKESIKKISIESNLERRHHKKMMFPKNIQDVINSKKSTVYLDMDSLVPQSSMNNYNTSRGFLSQSVLHHYKPSDPSEINLMVASGFRFSPPIWKNFQKIPKKKESHYKTYNLKSDDKTNFTLQPRKMANRNTKKLNWRRYPGATIQAGDIEVLKSETLVLI